MKSCRGEKSLQKILLFYYFCIIFLLKGACISIKPTTAHKNNFVVQKIRGLKTNTFRQICSLQENTGILGYFLKYFNSQKCVMEFYLPRATLFVEYNKDHEKTISSNSIIAYRTLHSKVAYLQRIFQYTLRERNTRYPKTQEKK